MNKPVENPPIEMILELSHDDIEIIKHDLMDCLKMNIHGVILGTKQKTLSTLNHQLRRQLVDAMFAYLSAYDKNERLKESNG